MALYQKIRPKTLDAIRGQKEIVAVLKKKLKGDDLPQVIMFAGPSGVGKTTTARILKKELGCDDKDFFEMNCADLRGIDNVREIKSRIGLAPWGNCRIYLIDESHKLTPDAQNAFLKILEDTPDNVYFFLATTEPKGLIKTIKTRCLVLDFKPLPDKEMELLVFETLKHLDETVSLEVLERLIDASEGSARQALMTLEKILAMEDEKDRLACIYSADAEKNAYDLSRALAAKDCRWSDVSKVVAKIEENPEAVRRFVLAYFRTMLLSGGPGSKQAARVINAFRDPNYDTGKSGLALLAFAAYDSCPG